MSKTKKATEQVESSFVAYKTIMRHKNFVRGLNDIRAGRAFDADLDDCLWSYDRGRLLGALAPTSMPLFIDGDLNPAAVRLFKAAFKRGLIR